MKANQASSTAKVIAASTLLLHAAADAQANVPLAAAALCREFLDTCRSDRWLARSARSPWTRWIWCGLERLTHPGIMRHYWLRKHWIEAQCRLAIAGNRIGRVIVLGAGFDTLCLRLAAEFNGVEFIEFDHPATQSVKTNALARASHLIPFNLRFISLDLATQDFPAEFKAASPPVLVIVEGVLMYLPEPAVEVLLRRCTELSQQSVQLILSYMRVWPDQRSGFRPSSRLIDWWLAVSSEIFKSTHTPEGMAKLLDANGYAVTDDTFRPGQLQGELLLRCTHRLDDCGERQSANAN